MTTPAAPALFHVYGRKAHSQPLTFLACVEAGELGADLKAQALAQVGAEGWLEVVAFPAIAIVTILPEPTAEPAVDR